MSRARYRCPDQADAPGSDGHTVVGCGAEFDAEPDHDGLIDCPECGIWFRASEPGVLIETPTGD